MSANSNASWQKPWWASSGFLYLLYLALTHQFHLKAPFQTLKCIVPLHLPAIFNMTISKLCTIHIVESQTKPSTWKTTTAVFHDLPTSQLKKTPGDPSEHALILKSQSLFSRHTWTKIKPQTFSSFFTKLQLIQNVLLLQIRKNLTIHGKVHRAIMHLEWALTSPFLLTHHCKNYCCSLNIMLYLSRTKMRWLILICMHSCCGTGALNFSWIQILCTNFIGMLRSILNTMATNLSNSLMSHGLQMHGGNYRFESLFMLFYFTV